MKRATTINISGQLFSIDEDAERALKHYIAELEHELKDEPENEEMLRDIESSIAEHLREQSPTANEPVTLLMVAQVKERIGHINDDSEDEKSSGSSRPVDWQEVFSKPFYKSRENKVVDGVCAGIAERLNVDALWVRLIFLALLLLTNGFMIIIYIVLIIILQEDTTDDSLRKKRKLTANAVVEQVKVQAHNVQKAANDTDALNKAGTALKRTGILFAKLARLAVCGIVAWILMLITIVFAYMAVSLLEPGKNVPFIGTARGGVFWVLVIGGYFAVILPLITLVISMFNSKRSGLNWFSISMFVAWFVAASLSVSAFSIEHKTIRDWTHNNHGSRWVDNSFIRIGAGNEQDNDFSCVSLIGNCEHRFSQPPKPPSYLEN